jgi:uncharacterized protein involved in oxidation of intracellular sulfur
MNILIILNRNPYDGSDVTWNALRLCGALLKGGAGVRLFLMNDSVDLARDETVKPDNYDYDLVAMLKDLYHEGLALKVCGTCMTRCGIYRNQPYFAEEIGGTMNDLAEWVLTSDKIMTF